MPWRGRTRTQEPEEQYRSQPEEIRPEVARAGPPLATSRMLGDPRLAHPANAGLRAGLLLQMQRHCGNACLQRAVADAPLSAEAEPDQEGEIVQAVTETALRGTQGSSFHLQPLADGMRVSLGLRALVDRVPPPEEEAGLEEEEEQPRGPESRTYELSLGSLEDRVSGTFTLSHRNQRASLSLGSLMGRCDPDIGANFGVSHHGSQYELSIQLDIVYRWDIHHAGRTNVLSANSAAVTRQSWSQVAYDLTPQQASPRRSPRVRYWCSDLSAQHELYHAQDYRGAFGRYKSNVETWLGQRSVSSESAARTLCDQAVQRLIGLVTGYMGEGDYAPCEVRAYNAGQAQYQARAGAVRQRAQQEGWPPGQVTRR